MDDSFEHTFCLGRSAPSYLLDRWSSIQKTAAMKTIVIVGDAMLDRLVTGRTERVSPEAASLVFAKDREVSSLGGAGNVAANVASLGGVPYLVTVLGDDQPGKELSALCQQQGLAIDGLLTSESRQTTLKTRYISQCSQLLRVDSEIRAPLSPADTERVLAARRGALKKDGVLVLSDYGKGMLLGDTARAILEEAKNAGMRTIVDPKQSNWSTYRGADVVAPNLNELAIAADQPIEALASNAALIAAARQLMAQHDLGAVVVTMGGNGLAMVPNGAEAQIIPTTYRERTDATGAGDTVVATVALALASGETLAIGAEIANYSAGCSVSAIGTVAVPHQDVTVALKSYHSAGKISNDESLQTLISSWKSAGLRIGFTNGCFDILHPGHLRLLEQAAAACDKLVVGLNSDASVRRLKGARRPILDQCARAQTLAAMALVDAVAIFEEDTPIHLIQAIEPDLLVKGGDYRAADVVGADLVTGAGGKVMIVKLVNGFSTSDIEERIIDRADETLYQPAEILSGSASPPQHRPSDPAQPWPTSLS